jgi:heat shock protein HspQ
MQIDTAGAHHDRTLVRELWWSGVMSAKMREAKFKLGDVVKHRIYPFRGIVFDIDPVFNSTEEWWSSIPAEVRPRKDQPFYHLLAENTETEYIAYVSEQNLLPDETGKKLRHPQVRELFVEENGTYRATFLNAH